MPLPGYCEDLAQQIEDETDPDKKAELIRQYEETCGSYSGGTGGHLPPNG